MSIAKPRTANLVETIGAGYRALNRRIWVLTIPASLSTLLWLGPTLGLGGVGMWLRSALAGSAGHLGNDGERVLQGILSSDIRLALAWLNFMPVLAPPQRDASGGLGLGGIGQLVVALALINGAALLLSSTFLTILSEAVSGERRSAPQLARRSLAVALAIARYLLSLTGVGLVLALPFLAISAIVVATLPATTLGVLLTWYIALFWAYVYTGFAPEAILISRAGPLRAIYHSVQVVRRDLSGSLGLLILTFVITSGLGLIWQRIAITPPGLALAILGSAYVGGGLSAARLVFYRERYRS